MSRRGIKRVIRFDDRKRVNRRGINTTRSRLSTTEIVGSSRPKEVDTWIAISLSNLRCEAWYFSSKKFRFERWIEPRASRRLITSLNVKYSDEGRYVTNQAVVWCTDSKMTPPILITFFPIHACRFLWSVESL